MSSTSAAASSPGGQHEDVPAVVPRTFGPSALATPANALTLARLLAAPVLIGLVLATGPSSWLLVGLWVVSTGSDGLDGWVARKMGATRSGAFLDPLADKFLVLGAMAALAAIGEIGWLAVAIIAAREVAMSAYRSVAGRRGVSIPARQSAKAKTFVQDLVVLLAFIPTVGLHHAAVVRDLLWLAVALTLYTGIEYALDGRRLMVAAQPAATSTPVSGTDSVGAS